MGGVSSGTNKKQYPSEMVDTVQSLYNSNWTQLEIAEHLGVTQRVIWRLMKNHNIKSRIAFKRNQLNNELELQNIST